MVVTFNPPINLSQLTLEMVQAGILQKDEGLGTEGTTLYPYLNGEPVNFADEIAAQQLVDSHSATKPKSDADYITEWNAPVRTGSPIQTQIDTIAEFVGLTARTRSPMNPDDGVSTVTHLK